MKYKSYLDVTLVLGQSFLENLVSGSVPFSFSLMFCVRWTEKGITLVFASRVFNDIKTNYHTDENVNFNS